jgi:hypothetical protein
MALSTYPAVSSPIKSIQRGEAVSSGTITISAVTVAKTFVRSFSNGSAGSVGATGTEAGTLSSSGGTPLSSTGGLAVTTISNPSYSGTRTFTAGATALTTALYGVVLTNSTTLTADGACFWEVVEYN